MQRHRRKMAAILKSGHKNVRNLTEHSDFSQNRNMRNSAKISNTTFFQQIRAKKIKKQFH